MPKQQYARLIDGQIVKVSEFLGQRIVRTRGASFKLSDDSEIGELPTGFNREVLRGSRSRYTPHMGAKQLAKLQML